MNQYHEGTLEFQNGGYQHDIRRYACKITKRESLYAGADAGAADPQGERRLSAGAERTEPADHRAAARGKIAMAHRAATDEICVTGGMGNAPSSKRRGLVRVSACCLLAPKDLACQVLFALPALTVCRLVSLISRI